MQICRFIPSWVIDVLDCMGGCIGFCITVDEQTNTLKFQGRPVKRSSFSEDFWSTSTMDLDTSGLQRQRSIASISAHNLGFDPHNITSPNTTNPNEFVNHGLILWNQTRQQWIGSKKSQKTTQTRESRLSWNATYESLLVTNKPFPQPIPLSEMVEILVDIWEQDGLFD